MAIIRKERLFSPSWVHKLTNRELLYMYEDVHDCREARNDAPDLLRRLDVLHNEISRRERNGMWVEDDWKVKG